MLQSTSQCRANFQAIGQVFSENHVSLPSTKSQGAHNLLLLYPQPASPNPTTSATQVGLYNQSGTPEVFFVPNNSQTPIQLTYPSIQTGIQTLATPTTPDIYYAQQYSFVAGPFVIYGGFIKAATQGQTVTLTPTTTLIYVGLVMETIPNFNQQMSAIPTGISGSSFNISYRQNITVPPVQNLPNIWYFAIGM